MDASARVPEACRERSRSPRCCVAARVWIGFAISLVFIGLFLYHTDFGEIRDAFAEANYAIAFASLPVYFAGIWVRTIRWQYLLRPGRARARPRGSTRSSSSA